MSAKKQSKKSKPAKAQLKVRDLKPKKDAKGGLATHKAGGGHIVKASLP